MENPPSLISVQVILLSALLLLAITIADQYKVTDRTIDKPSIERTMQPVPPVQPVDLSDTGQAGCGVLVGTCC